MNEKIRKLIKMFVPAKGDPLFELIRKSVFCVSLFLVFVFSGLLIYAVVSGGAALPAYSDTEDEFIEIEGSVSLAPDIIPEPPEVIIPDKLEEYLEYFEQNNDMVGWINIPGTRLDNPVVQSLVYNDEGRLIGTNRHYTDIAFDGKPHKDGTIFADFRFPLTATFRPNNTVLYGHNLLNGKKFAAAANYWPYYRSASINIDFYLKNPIINFDTLYEKGQYKVFAAIFVHTEENKYDDVFDYFRRREFTNRDEFYDFIVNVLDRSGFYTDVDIRYGDEFLTLSTCHWPLGRTSVDSRIAVFARRVREGESPEVNTDVARLNPTPLFFKEYYRRRGGAWGGRTWDTGKVEGLDEWIARREGPVGGYYWYPDAGQ